MMQSLMNILTSSTLLPRLNGENLLGVRGLLEDPPFTLLHPCGPGSLIKSSLPRLIQGKERAGGGSGAAGASCSCSPRLPAANAMEKMSPVRFLMLSRPSPRIPAPPASPAAHTRAGLEGPRGESWHNTQPFWSLGGVSSASPMSSGGEKGLGEGGGHFLCELCAPLTPIPIPGQTNVLSFPARLDEGFPLPLLDRIQLSKILVQFHQVSEGEQLTLAGAHPAAPKPLLTSTASSSSSPSCAGN